jgi:hypothetical protein
MPSPQFDPTTTGPLGLVGVDVGPAWNRSRPRSIYETRHGRAATASQLLGTGVDLSSQDGPAKTTSCIGPRPDGPRSVYTR